MNDIEEILAKGWVDSNSTIRHDIPIKSVFIERDLLKKFTNIVSEYKTPIIICDENTFEIALSLNVNNIYKLSANASPTKDNIDIVINASKKCDLIIAVGSGSINDLCKYTASILKKPYIIYATAPSMNGYCSPTSSIIDSDNIKKSIYSCLPQVVFMDLDVISKAPQKMIAAGLGDMLCRSTVHADWVVGHRIFDSECSYSILERLKSYEVRIINHIDKIISCDVEGLRILCESLIFSGIAMFVAKGSYPASQAEHMIVHNYKMSASEVNDDNLHGEEIAVTTLVMKRLQEYMLAKENLSFNDMIFADKKLNFQQELYLEKIQKYKMIRKKEKLINNSWHNLKDNISSGTLEARELKSLFKKASLPTTYKELGWDRDSFAASIKSAVYTRDRYTFLDLAIMTSCLDEFCEIILSDS